VALGIASRAGLPIASRTTSWVWLPSRLVLESITEPVIPRVRDA
jgi:hypothetical protein